MGFEPTRFLFRWNALTLELRRQNIYILLMYSVASQHNLPLLLFLFRLKAVSQVVPNTIGLQLS